MAINTDYIASTMSIVAPVGVEDIGDDAQQVVKEALQDGLTAIRQDHDNIRNLFKAYKEISSEKTEAKLRASRQIVTAITQHASAEERCLYPLIQQKMKEQEGYSKLLYDIMTMDDQINKEFLHYFESHTPHSPTEWQLFDRQMDKFIMVEEEHLTKEEQTVMDPLGELLSQEEKHQLWVDFSQSLQNAPLHPYPTVGGTTTVPARLLHPIAGAMDRAAHAISGMLHKVVHVSEESKAAHEGHTAGMHVEGAPLTSEIPEMATVQHQGATAA